MQTMPSGELTSDAPTKAEMSVVPSIPNAPKSILKTGKPSKPVKHGRNVKLFPLRVRYTEFNVNIMPSISEQDGRPPPEIMIKECAIVKQIAFAVRGCIGIYGCQGAGSDACTCGQGIARSEGIDRLAKAATDGEPLEVSALGREAPQVPEEWSFDANPGRTVREPAEAQSWRSARHVVVSRLDKGQPFQMFEAKQAVDIAKKRRAERQGHEKQRLELRSSEQARRKFARKFFTTGVFPISSTMRPGDVILRIHVLMLEGAELQSGIEDMLTLEDVQLACDELERMAKSGPLNKMLSLSFELFNSTSVCPRVTSDVKSLFSTNSIHATAAAQKRHSAHSSLQNSSQPRMRRVPTADMSFAKKQGWREARTLDALVTVPKHLKLKQVGGCCGMFRRTVPQAPPGAPASPTSPMSASMVHSPGILNKLVDGGSEKGQPGEGAQGDQREKAFHLGGRLSAAGLLPKPQSAPSVGAFAKVSLRNKNEVSGGLKPWGPDEIVPKSTYIDTLELSIAPATEQSAQSLARSLADFVRIRWTKDADAEKRDLGVKNLLSSS